MGVDELFCLGERSELRKKAQGCADSCTKVPCSRSLTWHKTAVLESNRCTGIGKTGNNHFEIM